MQFGRRDKIIDSVAHKIFDGMLFSNWNESPFSSLQNLFPISKILGDRLVSQFYFPLEPRGEGRELLAISFKIQFLYRKHHKAESAVVTRTREARFLETFKSFTNFYENFHPEHCRRIYDTAADEE